LRALGRRDFLRALAAAAAAGLFPRHGRAAPAAASPRRIWIGADLHVGFSEGGKDGEGWFRTALNDMESGVPGIRWAAVLGDLTHGGERAVYETYRRVKETSSIPRWIELAGNHDYDAGGIPHYRDCIGPTTPRRMIDAGIRWYFLSDENLPGGRNLSGATLDWLEQDLAREDGMPTVVCSHHLPPDTVLKSDHEAFYLKPRDRVLALLAAHRIDLWLCGHEHLSPYSAERIARVGRTLVVNVASISHAYGTGECASTVIELDQDGGRLRVRRRNHESRSYDPVMERIVSLR
jgi:3',5'-cyclic AMP phosphodiesterase CpdA